MFNRYWRDYPFFVQLLLLIVMIFILAGFAIKVGMPVLIHSLTGVSDVNMQLLTLDSDSVEIRAALLWQGVFSISVFLIPSLLFTYQVTPHVRSYLGLRKPGLPIHWLLSALLILGAMPVMLQMQALLRMVDFGTDALALQAANDRLTEAFLQMPEWTDFLLVLIVMAVLPAVGEELFFRGIMMRFMAKRHRLFASFDQIPKPASSLGSRMWLPVSITAVMFAMMHSSVYGFPSILLAGFILGLVYYLTGSLWCSILVHLINNGLQVMLVYFFRDNKILIQMEATDLLPWWMVVLGLLVAGTALRLLWKNRRPLEAEWTTDYLPHEQPKLKSDNDA